MGQAWGETSAVTLASRATLHMSASCVAQLPSKQSSLLACRWHALAIAGGGGSTLARDRCSSCTVSVVVGSCAFASGKGGQISVVVRSYVCSVFVNALGDMCSDECCLVLMRSACRFRFRGLVYHDIIGSEGSVQSSDEMHRGGS